MVGPPVNRLLKWPLTKIGLQTLHAHFFNGILWQFPWEKDI